MSGETCAPKAVIHQLVNKSTGADLRATKMLIDMTKDIEKKAGAASPPEPAPLTDADANSSIHTSGSNNDRYTLIAGRNHGALMTCASLFLPGRGVGQAAHSVGVARGRLQSCLAHQARVRSHKSEPFGFGERDVDAVLGGVIECQRALFLDDPFDGNAGIDDQIAHRSSRASRSKTSAGVCLRPPVSLRNSAARSSKLGSASPESA